MTDTPILDALDLRRRSGFDDAPARAPRITGGERLLDRSLPARVDALAMRGGAPVQHPHRDVHLFRGYSLFDHARDLLGEVGVRVSASEPAAVWRHAIEQRALGTVDVPALIENAAHVSLMAGWHAAAVSYPLWCRSGSLAALRPETRVTLSAHPTLPKVGEHGEIKAVARSTLKEYLTPYRYASTFAVSDQVLLGDDAGAITAEPMSFGFAARRTVEKAAVDLLCSASLAGPTLTQDSTALFHTNHGNLAASGASPTVSTLDTARKQMRTRTDPTSGEVLNTVPRTLLVPAALETAARTLAAAQNSLTADQDGDLRVAVSPWLDGYSTTGWYLFADAATADVFEVAFPDGADAPELDTRRGWSRDGAEFRVALTFAVAALDFRGAYRNPGA